MGNGDGNLLLLWWNVSIWMSCTSEISGDCNAGDPSGSLAQSRPLEIK